LWEGSHRVAENGSHEVGCLLLHINRHKRAFVKVDVQSSHAGEGVKEHLKAVELVGVRPEDDEGIVAVLENKAR
jgi:hypothetical protein